MSRRPSFIDVEREILADLPPCGIGLDRAAEFAESFGSAVVEAADMAALLVGTVPPTDLPAAVGKMVRTVVGAIDTAGDMTGLAEHAWIAGARRWAVGAFFARLTEVSRSAGAGGRA